MTGIIKKAIIPVTEEDKDFFPLSRCVPKELLPLGDTPVIQRAVDEVIECDIREVFFILSPEKKEVANHFKDIEKIPPENPLFKKEYTDVSFSSLSQKKSSGSGYTVFRAKEKIAEDAFALSFPDVVFYGKKSSLLQLLAIYRTSQKQVVGLKEVKDREVSSSYIVETEKIANKLYKVKKIIDKPQADETGSRLALVGRYIFTPAVFDYLKNSGTKTSIADALNEMVSAGKTVYGHECEGVWFSLKNKEAYLETQKFFLDNYFNNGK